MKLLSPNEMSVFHTALLQADASVSELAQQLGMRVQTVRRALETLYEKKIFLGKRPYLNYCLLGVTEYLLYLALNDGAPACREALLKMLCAHERVSLVAEVGGDYHYEIRFLAHDSRDLIAFTESLAEAFPSKISIPATAVIHREEYSATHPGPASRPMQAHSLTIEPTDHRIKIEEIDHRILVAITNSGFTSLRDAGRKLGAAESTVTYRVRSLEKAGLIKGYFHLCDTKPFMLLPVVLLIEGKTFTRAQHAELLAFCQGHPEIAVANILLGPWQARLFTRAPCYDSILAIVHELYRQFPGTINGIRILPQLRFHKFSLYPFRHHTAAVGGLSRPALIG